MPLYFVLLLFASLSPELALFSVKHVPDIKGRVFARCDVSTQLADDHAVYIIEEHLLDNVATDGAERVDVGVLALEDLADDHSHDRVLLCEVDLDISLRQ